MTIVGPVLHLLEDLKCPSRVGLQAIAGVYRGFAL